MQPHNMSKLIEFLDASGEGTLVLKVQEFQAQAERSEYEDYNLHASCNIPQTELNHTHNNTVTVIMQQSLM